MIGEPQFAGWNPEQSEPEPTNQIETIEGRQEQRAEMERAFNASRIRYPNERERELNAKDDLILCERLNQGEKFALVFREPVVGGLGVDGRWTLNSEHLYFADIVFGDGQRMHFPNFEGAVGLDFSQEMVEAYWRGSERAEKNKDSEVFAEVAELDKWLREKFSEQFVGIVEPNIKDDPDVAVDNAKSQAIVMIKGDSAALEGPEWNAQ